MAGFYSYLVVLSDYGYMPHVLPGLGADDNWGKQPLYCQVEGGVFRNENGDHLANMLSILVPRILKQKQVRKTSIAINDAQSKGYKFWDWRIDSKNDPQTNAKVQLGTLKSEGLRSPCKSCER